MENGHVAYDFTAIHRPEHMLFVCNLLSRYNLHASKLREAEKDDVKARDTRIEQRILGGMSINKGVRKLAANISALTLPTSFCNSGQGLRCVPVLL